MDDPVTPVFAAPLQRDVRRPPLIGFALVAAGTAAMAVQAWYVGTITALATGEWFIDWATYSRAVGRWLTGHAIFPPEQLRGPYDLTLMSGYGYAYPPASVPLMTPFAPDVLGLMLWEAVLVGLFLSGLWAIAGVGFPQRRWEAFGVTMLGTAFFGPAMQGFVAGNVNMATAGLVAWAWVGLPRPGIVSGVFGIIKIFPAAVAVLYGWRVVVVALVTMVVIAVATLPFVGLRSWLDFVVALRDAQPSCQPTSLSFACMAEPALGLGTAKLVSLAAAAALLAVAGVAGPTLIGMTSVVAAIMVPAGDLHLHYWSMALVLLVIAVARIARMRRGEPPDPAASPLLSRWGFAREHSASIR